jgi:hypothetical protein
MLNKMEEGDPSSRGSNEFANVRSSYDLVFLGLSLELREHRRCLLLLTYHECLLTHLIMLFLHGISFISGRRRI